MNEFNAELQKFVGIFGELKTEQEALNQNGQMLEAKMQIENEKFGTFLKSHGLPDNFTMPEALALAISKARE